MAACSRCQKPKVVARGLCGACYQHCKKHDLPLPPKATRSFEEWAALAERTPSGCLLWPGPVTDHGYGYSGQRSGEIAVHRISYVKANGPIPDNYSIDHLCHNQSPLCTGGPRCLHRRCFEPLHLDAVPLTVNQARSPNVTGKTETCPQGHHYSGNNLYLSPLGGHRQCRACRSAATKRRFNRTHPDHQLAPNKRTHCPQGHPYDAANTDIKTSTGERRCRQCHQDQARARYWRKKREDGCIVATTGSRPPAPRR